MRAHGLGDAHGLGRAEFELLLEVRLLEGAVALGEGVDIQIGVAAQEILGVLSRDDGMQAVLLRQGVHEVGFRVAGLRTEQDHGMRCVLGESGDGADSLPGVDDVLANVKHASSN